MLFFAQPVIFIIILNRFAYMFVANFKKFVVILLMCLSAYSLRAQQAHFIYVQTENGQPFYVKLNNKVVSSSPAGYLILPNLSDGDYQLTVGFPKNEFPEEGFQISIDKKNEGFLLKNFEEKGWGLFNLQSLALLPGTSSTNSTAVVTAPIKVQDDPFSKMLANVVKDSSILQSHEPPVTIKKDSAEVVVKDTLSTQVAMEDTLAGSTVNTLSGITAKDTSAQRNEQVSNSPAMNSPELPPAVAQPITKLLSESDADGMQMVYIDKNDRNNDTVRIFIPAEKISTPDTAKKGVLEDKSPAPYNNTDPSQLTITPTIIKPVEDTPTLLNDTIRIYKESVKKDNAVEIEDSPAPKNTEAPAQITVTQPVEKNDSKEPKVKQPEIIVLPKAVTSSKVNSDCKGFATDEDFLKLRKKMAAEDSNDDMIRIAKKAFRSKCFSTGQIKNLSYLFLTNEGKYMFFDAAYPFASDSDQYHLLESQLSDEYYINRFNAMIHN